mgnify:CR=1 FL=1
MGLISAFALAVMPHPPTLPGHPSDKVQHILAFVVLAALATTAYPRLSPVILLLLLSAFGSLIELVQSIAWTHRDSDMLDWIADTVASGATLLFIQLWRRRVALTEKKKGDD